MSTNTIGRTVDSLRPTAGGGLLVVLASVVASVLAYGQLGARMRVHWTIGDTYYVGPEHAPTLAVLAAFPIAVAILAVGFGWLGRRLAGSAEFEEARIYYELAVLGSLLAVLVIQVAVIAANLGI